MSSEERIWKAINLEEPDRVPCFIDVGFQTAKVAGISLRELMFEPKIAWQAGKRVFEAYGGGFDVWSDYSTTGAQYLAPIPNSHSSMFFDWKLPGVDLPENSLPQMVEVPIMEKVEGYKILTEKGIWHYSKKLPPHLNKLYTKCLSEGFKVAADSEKWFKERCLPTSFPGSLIEPPCDVISFLRSFRNYLVDMVRHPDKIIAASETLTPQLTKAAIDLTKFTNGKVILLGTGRASISFLSPKQFEEIVWPFFRKEAEDFMNQGHTVLFHLDN
nr:hypothetical protein [Candidatus Njordarchaeum guaymaensis]